MVPAFQISVFAQIEKLMSRRDAAVIDGGNGNAHKPQEVIVSVLNNVTQRAEVSRRRLV